MNIVWGKLVVNYALMLIIQFIAYLFGICSVMNAGINGNRIAVMITSHGVRKNVQRNMKKVDILKSFFLALKNQKPITAKGHFITVMIIAYMVQMFM